MQKIIKNVDKKAGIMQITTSDERWYAKESRDKATGLPVYEFIPSVTWIAGSYPKGVAFYKWLANKGWDEAEAIKSAAGDKGSKIHLAIQDLIKGLDVKIDSYYPNKDGQMEELTAEEYEAITSFVGWFEQERPKILGSEYVVWGDGYAGTVDIKYQKQDGRIGILDVKTSQNLWPEFELQISAYKHADKQDAQFLEILQIGYKRNKNGWKITEIEDKFNLFLAAKQIWTNEHGEEKPKQINLPLKLTLKNYETHNQSDQQKSSQYQIRKQRKIRASVQRKAGNLA